MLAMLLEAGDGGEDRAVGLRHVDPAGRERTAVAQRLHVEQQILVDVAGLDEIAVDGMRQTGGGDGLRGRDHGLRDDLAAVDATGGEVQRLALDVGVAAVLRRVPQSQHLEETFHGGGFVGHRLFPPIAYTVNQVL